MQKQHHDKPIQFPSISVIQHHFSCTHPTQLNMHLISPQYARYRTQPYMYVLQRMAELSDGRMTPQTQSRYCSMLIDISQKYNAIPYHNISHGFDVMTAVDRFFSEFNMQKRLRITNQELSHILIAAYAHDNGHQGLTNNFYINSGHALALKYDNISPLQNMHSHNLLASIKKFHITITPEIKQLMVKLILATDNAHHFQMLKKMESYHEGRVKALQDQNNRGEAGSEGGQMAATTGDPKQDEVSQQHKEMLLEMIIHCSDLTSCGKTVPEYLRWNDVLYTEFKYEYNLQRQLQLKKYSFNFDLKNQKESFAKQNLSFLGKFILPFFKLISLIVPPFEKEFLNAVQIKKYFEEEVKAIENDKQQNGNNENGQK